MLIHSPDRTHDVMHPPNWDKETKPCTCGKRMIIMLDENGMKLRPPQMGWYWYCYGCLARQEGGTYHPRTRDEYHSQRWLDLQAPKTDE